MMEVLVLVLMCLCVSGSDRPLPGSHQQPDQRRRWKVSEQQNGNFLLSKPTKPLFLNCLLWSNSRLTAGRVVVFLKTSVVSRLTEAADRLRQLRMRQKCSFKSNQLHVSPLSCFGSLFMRILDALIHFPISSFISADVVVSIRLMVTWFLLKARLKRFS